MTLKDLIEKNNKIYADYIEKTSDYKLSHSKEEIKTLAHERWQFVHDYAKELETYCWENLHSMSKKEFELLDLVPYFVYTKISEKVRRMISVAYKEES